MSYIEIWMTIIGLGWLTLLTGYLNVTIDRTKYRLERHNSRIEDLGINESSNAKWIKENHYKIFELEVKVSKKKDKISKMTKEQIETELKKKIEII